LYIFVAQRTARSLFQHSSTAAADTWRTVLQNREPMFLFTSRYCPTTETKRQAVA